MSMVALGDQNKIFKEFSQLRDTASIYMYQHFLYDSCKMSSNKKWNERKVKHLPKEWKRNDFVLSQNPNLLSQMNKN